MTSPQFIVIMRWLFVPVAAALGIIAALLPSAVVNRIVHDILWSTGHHMHGKVFMGYYSIPVYGAFAAFLFVVLGTWAAPKHRSTVAVILLALGGVMAWHSVGHFYSPLIQIGQPSLRIWEPIIATYLGGLIACFMVYFRAELKRLFRFKHS